MGRQDFSKSARAGAILRDLADFFFYMVSKEAFVFSTWLVVYLYRLRGFRLPDTEKGVAVTSYSGHTRRMAD